MRPLLAFFTLSLVAFTSYGKKVNKKHSGKVYVHIMPWFDARESNKDWGIHWKMKNQNPDHIHIGSRQIAAHYYPQIGPYASGDGVVIEYQLLLMKYAGVDGIIIDWPGTIQAWDYPKNHQNSLKIIEVAERVG